ncbi:caspase domain-containing protein [Armillaria nabsnona]|nr:caspase domain-containing protein [Armillaria nabsnona]
MQNATPSLKSHKAKSPVKIKNNVRRLLELKGYSTSHLLQRSDAKALTTQDADQPKGTANDGNRATIFTHNGEKIFALIIGINDYGHDGLYNLKGAVTDAKRFEKFLRAKLKVPDMNISYLHDKKATRSAIIKAFRSLENNKAIVKNDAAIIIYYAGHGSVVEKPKAWEDWFAPDDRIEMLCPADMTLSDSDLPENRRVEGIPDRTISRLLLDLSTAKGDNITLILDCCHSAGMNRGVGIGGPDPTSQHRSRRLFHDQIKVSAKCDSDIYSRPIDRYRPCDGDEIQVTCFSGSLWDSHVLLAACSRHQYAWEVHEEGLFTTALLKVLEEDTAHELTYQSLMHRLHMPKYQRPHWDGRHSYRRLFGPPEEAADGHRILCCRIRQKTRFALQSGSLLGTTEGSEFEMFKPDLVSDTQPFATASVVEVRTFHSYLTISSELNQHTALATHGDVHPWYARLTKAADAKLSVYCENSKFLTRVVKTDACGTKLIGVVDPVLTKGKASLILTVQGNTVSFDRHGEEKNPLFNEGSLVKGFPWKIPRTARADEIADVRKIINYYARFSYHLTRKSLDHINKFVSIKMIKLVDAGSNYKPASEDMLHYTAGGVSKPVQVEVDFESGVSDAPYGFIIHNVCKVYEHLYVYLLYFDASTLQIDIWFSSQKSPGDIETPHPVDSRLGKNSRLKLFESQDMTPIMFSLPEGQDVDICFFQFFVATESINLESMLQSSILPELGATRGAFRIETPQAPVAPDARHWASMTIPVVQKRRGYGVFPDTRHSTETGNSSIHPSMRNNRTSRAATPSSYKKTTSTS